jgi:hypothetical protein
MHVTAGMSLSKPGQQPHAPRDEAARTVRWLTTLTTALSLTQVVCEPHREVHVAPPPVPIHDSPATISAPIQANVGFTSAATPETSRPAPDAPDSSVPPVRSQAPSRPPLPSTANTPGEIVLYNPETAAAMIVIPPNSNAIWGSELTTQEQKQVVDAVFPGKHLASEEECPEEVYSLSLKDQRASGYFRPYVRQVVAGAFTAPGTNEKLYLIAVGECYAPHSEQWGTCELAVLRNGTLVSRAPLDGALHKILLASDLDGDGRNEILLSYGDGGQGSYFESVDVVRMDTSHLAVVKGSTSVLEADCTGPALGGEKLSILYVTRGPRPRFRIETHERPCHGHGYWELLSQPPPFFGGPPP